MRDATRGGGGVVIRVIGVIGLVCASAIGCEQQVRVVDVRGGLQNIPGAEGGVRPDPPPGGERPVPGTRPRTHDGSYAAFLEAAYGPPPGEPIEGEPLRRELPDGSVHLVSRSPAQLIAHLTDTLQAQEHDLLFEQLIADSSKVALRDRGRDERAAVEFLTANEAEVRRLLLALRAGADTPGARFENRGNNRFEITARIGADRRFNTLRMRIEGGRFVLEDID